MQTQCPKCFTNNLNVSYILIQREDCTNCHYYHQGRAPLPELKGVLDMIKQVTTSMIDDNNDLEVLAQVMQSQLARIRRRQTKIANRDNGGAPNRQEQWR